MNIKMRKNRIGKTVRSLLLILAMAGAVVALLAAMNWLPSLMEKGFIRQYSSIEEAKRSLGLDNVMVPAYFPEGISWPPSLILAQKKPYKAVVMEFKKAETMETLLIISQSSVQGSDAQLQRIKLSELKEETKYKMKGKIALLQVGTCDNSKPCS
ncbi:MAG: hypothetical protein C0415_03945, partial [Thermodesulfovibrio sp.]|nr:hypothetical protein [Thermodesulfovibrio sp.]